jgi:hypothetical protein
LRRELPRAIVLILGILMIADFFLSIPALQELAKQVQNGVIVVAAFSLGLACVNLLRIHGKNVSDRKGKWGYSLALIAALLVTAGLGIVVGPNHNAYKFVFDNIQTPCSATVYAMTAFYMASAAYRTFRARSLEAGLLLVSAAILMLGRAPLGEMIFSGFPGWADWLMNVVNLAGQRGILIGSGIGAIAAGMRTLVGIDRRQTGAVE